MVPNAVGATCGVLPTPEHHRETLTSAEGQPHRNISNLSEMQQTNLPTDLLKMVAMLLAFELGLILFCTCTCGHHSPAYSQSHQRACLPGDLLNRLTARMESSGDEEGPAQVQCSAARMMELMLPHALVQVVIAVTAVTRQSHCLCICHARCTPHPHPLSTDRSMLPPECSPHTTNEQHQRTQTVRQGTFLLVPPVKRAGR